MQLAEDSLGETNPWRVALVRVALALLVVALIVAAAMGLKSLVGGKPANTRQMARITILPDRPPPPPPRDEKKPEPAKETTQAIREQPVAVVDAPKPANEPIKMEGQTGDGASPFAAGTVRQDYAGGAPVIGQSGGASAVDRNQSRLYVASTTQTIAGLLERHLSAEISQASANFRLWIARDGHISRFELVASGSDAVDLAIRSAFDAVTNEARLPPPPAVPQPLRYRLEIRPQAGG
jgi:hypothetical protein